MKQQLKFLPGLGEACPERAAISEQVESRPWDQARLQVFGPVYALIAIRVFDQVYYQPEEDIENET